MNNIVITVSRQLGSRGSYIAAEVAKRLGLRYIDREILQRAAQIAGYPDEDMITSLEQHEKVPGVLARILSALSTMPMTPTIASATLREGYAHDERVAMMMLKEHISRDEAYQRLLSAQRRAEIGNAYAELVQQVILEFAQAGNVILVGRGGQVILQNMPHVFHVRVEASEENRIQRIMQRLGLERQEAERQIRQSDKGRARYLRHYHNAVWNDTRLYHLTINTTKVPVDIATNVICAAVQQLSQKISVQAV